jgi:hypothetical protein
LDATAIEFNAGRAVPTASAARYVVSQMRYLSRLTRTDLLGRVDLAPQTSEGRSIDCR